MGSDVIVQVKKNQKALYNDCEYTARNLKPKSTYRYKEKNKNRKETRIVKVYEGAGFSAIDWDQAYL